MPPRISSNLGDTRGGPPPPPPGGHQGGELRGSQPGGLSSAGSEATPMQITPPMGQPSVNRGRGRGRGRGANRGSPPSAPIPVVSTSITPTAATATTENPPTNSPQGAIFNPPNPSRGQPTANRGRGNVRGRGTNRGGASGSPPSVPTNPVFTPITTETPATSSQITPVNPSIPSTGQPAASRGHGRGRGRGANRGATPGRDSSHIPTSFTTEPSSATPSQSAIRDNRGGGRGGARGSPADSPSTFRGGPSHAHGRGGLSAGGPPHTPTTTNSPGNMLFHEFFTTCISNINPRSDIPDIPDHVTTFGAKRPGFGTGGTKTKVIINAFPATVPDIVIYQYDGEIFPSYNITKLRRSCALIHFRSRYVDMSDDLDRLNTTHIVLQLYTTTNTLQDSIWSS